MMPLQKVDLPAPAGPVTSTAYRILTVDEMTRMRLLYYSEQVWIQSLEQDTGRAMRQAARESRTDTDSDGCG